jgi:tetratricopeptide (TPR) repeat protein
MANLITILCKPRRLSRILIAALALSFALSSSAICQEDDRSAEAITFFNSGQDAHEKGDFGAAIRDYEKALEIIPDFPEAELQRGSAYQSIGKLDVAESAFRRAVELRDDWSLALASLGSVLVQKRKFSEAETFLGRAIELDEQNFPAYSAMTELRLETKADPKVLSLLLARISMITAKANPTAAIWASRAALESALGDLKNARSSAARARQVDPKSQFALSISANIALAEDDPAAADVFVKRLESLPGRSDAITVLRARVIAAQGNADEALDLLRSISRPDAAATDLMDAIRSSTSTDTAELEKQLSADPKSSPVLARLCSLYRVSDPAKALEYCRRASESAPQDIEPVIGYAAALVQARRYDDAVVVLRKLLAIAPDNSTVHANLGTALFQLKRYAEAKVEFRWLTDRQPDQPVAFYFLGIVHDQLMEFADAAANYQIFLRLADPRSSKLEIDKVNLRLPVIYNLLKEGKGKKRG